jgi:hypothetical protein
MTVRDQQDQRTSAPARRRRTPDLHAEGEVGWIVPARDGRLYVELPVAEFGSNTTLRALPTRLA